MAQETFDWEIGRPSDYTGINERVESSYSDGAATVGLGVNISTYYENDAQLGGRDGVGLLIAATANTREIISYAASATPYTWYTVDEPTYITGDDESKGIPPFLAPVRFYGGRRSAEYDGVIVCSNGFITFDSISTERYYGSTIPSEDGPNTFIAPFWTDLKPNEGGSITWGYVEAVPAYVISWNEVPNKYGTPQTFQVVIEWAPGSPGVYRNSRIWFNYQSITLDDDTTVGIEDNRGLRGVSYNYQDLVNGMSLKFQQASNNAFIQYLTIKLNRGGDQYAQIDIDESTDWIRGHNVELTSSEPDALSRWAFALAGAGALLLELTPWGWVQCAGFILGTTLVGIDLAEALAYSLSPAEPVEVVDDLPDPVSESHIKVAAVDRWTDYFTCVDALAASRAWWMFTDNNDQDHEITITAELAYTVFDHIGYPIVSETIQTSVDLSVFIGQYTLSIWASSGGTTNPSPGLHYYDYGSIESVFADEDPDCEFDYWLLDGAYAGNDNPYDVTMKSDHTLKAYFSDNGGGYPPGGCPFVSTWDGTDYVLDNNLLPASETSSGTDIVDYYKLEQPSVLDEDGMYRLLLSEFENEHDFFDYVQLIAVDHSSDVNVAVSPYGEILTYGESSSPMAAVDDNNRNVKHVLGAIDGDYYEGYNGSYIVLNFGDELDVSNGAKLVMRADSRPLKIPSIHVQIQDEDNNWNTVATVIPRGEWATEIFDLSECLPDAKGNLKVRLYFTAWHKIDYVGLDTSEQGAFEVHYASPAEAIHNTLGDVKDPLMQNDNVYAELLPSEQITLKFTLPQSTEDVRDFIIIVEGRYFTITS